MTTARAQSETVGVLMLTAVIVLLVGTVGILIVSNVMSAADEDPLVDVEGNATAQYVTIHHAGGESRATADVVVILEGDSRNTTRLSSWDDVRGNDPDRFEPGDSWRLSKPVSGDRLEITVVDEAANVILDSETVTVTPS